MKKQRATREFLEAFVHSNPEHSQRDIRIMLRAQHMSFTQSVLSQVWAKVRKPGAGSGIPKGKFSPTVILEDDIPLAEAVQIKEPDDKPLYGGILPAPDVFRRQLDGRKFLFTCAQNNTALHDAWWKSIQHFCKVNGVQLGVSRISYNKSGWQKVTTESEGLWYDKRIVPYILDEQVKVATDLVFCGELDILPTASDPLSGLENFTGPNSAIIPHTKMQMKSLATMKNEDAKFLYTTGTCTLRNYIDRKAGQVASYHHIYGAMYVEVDDQGNWFARQINADDDGVFYDLDRVYGPGWDREASLMGRPYVNLGDVHIEKMDSRQLAGALDMLRTLNPKGVFLHDLLDFEARNHHNKQDPLFLHEQHFRRSPSVENGIEQAARFLGGLQRNFPTTVMYVIRSNHDEAFKRWMREGVKYPDPVNARYWHECNAKYYSMVEAGKDFDVYQWAILEAGDKAGYDLTGVQFIQEDQSLVLNGIEYGMHGHLGPNGARGNPKGLRQIGRRANTGHTHSAGIIDGVYTSGVLASLDMVYNKGPSSWSCSHIVTYPSGKRSIITQRKDQWRVKFPEQK